MALQTLANSGLNTLTAGTDMPANTDGIVGASNEMGVLIWANQNIQVLGLLSKGGDWITIDTLGMSNQSISIFWEDYYAVNFRSQTGDSETVRLFPRYSGGYTSGIPNQSSSDIYVIDEADEYSDLPEYSGADDGKYLTVTAGGELSFTSVNLNGGQAASFAAPSISSISNSNIFSGNVSDIEINGHNFAPDSDIYVFQGAPTPTQISNLINNVTDIFGNLTSHADGQMLAASYTIVNCGKISIKNSVNHYGYKNPTKMILRLNPTGAHASNTYSILVVNPDNKKFVLNNCFSVT